MSRPSEPAPQEPAREASARAEAAPSLLATPGYRGMRSPRCAGCRLVVEHCLCGELEPLAITTPLFLFVHALEVARPSNSAWIVARIVSSATLYVHGRPRAPRPVVPPARWLALRPEGRPLTADDAGAGLLVADGTWSQARHMNQRIPALRDAEPVRLEGPAAVPRVRRATGHRLCTAEAVARALFILGEQEAARRLVLATTRWAERTLKVRAGPSRGG